LHLLATLASVKMVGAWYMDASDADQRLPHQCEPNEPVSLEALKELGVNYWSLDADRYVGQLTQCHI
jgi:hypothetical protein